MLGFERGKTVSESLNVGRGPGAFKVTKVTLKMVAWYDGPGGGPNLGRYFHNDAEQEFDLPLTHAYVFLSMVLKGDFKGLRHSLRHVLKEIDCRATAHFTFFFQGEEGEVKLKDVITGPDSTYHWRDFYGMDLIVDNKILKIPDGRLIPNSDFQFYLDGELYPGTPGPV